jgi:hypothetical protein
MVDTSKTAITGTLGDMGPVQPIVSSYYISNSGETLVYLSTAQLTCELLTMSPWLGQVQAGAQVIEVIVKGDPKVQSYAVPPGEVNYAPGGKSHNYEKNADSGEIVFTKVDLKNLVEGTVSAKYGSTEISGTFHATYCDMGQGY